MQENGRQVTETLVLSSREQRANRERGDYGQQARDQKEKNERN